MPCNQESPPPASPKAPPPSGHRHPHHPETTGCALLDRSSAPRTRFEGRPRTSPRLSRLSFLGTVARLEKACRHSGHPHVAGAWGSRRTDVPFHFHAFDGWGRDVQVVALTLIYTYEYVAAPGASRCRHRRWCGTRRALLTVISNSPCRQRGDNWTGLHWERVVRTLVRARYESRSVWILAAWMPRLGLAKLESRRTAVFSRPVRCGGG